MREREKQHFNLFESKPVLGLLIFTSLLFGFYALNSSYQKYQIKKEISRLDTSISEIEEVGSEMKDEKNKLTNEEYIEREARVKLNFKKSNEEVVILIDRPYVSDEKDNSVSTSEAETQKETVLYSANAKKWIEVIFGN